jgi:hypothetical protein
MKWPGMGSKEAIVKSHDRSELVDLTQLRDSKDDWIVP